MGRGKGKNFARKVKSLFSCVFNFKTIKLVFNFPSSDTYYCIIPQWNAELIVLYVCFSFFLLPLSLLISLLISEPSSLHSFLPLYLTSIFLTICPPSPPPFFLQEHDQVFLLSQSAAGRLVCVRGVVRGGKMKALSRITGLIPANCLQTLLSDDNQQKDYCK